MSEATAIQTTSPFSESVSFEHAQRVAKMLAQSDLVPKQYQGNVQNVMIALEMSNRIGASPLMVMQSLHIIQGRPSWSSTFIIAAINSCKRFTTLKFKVDGDGEEHGCTAYAKELETGELLESPKVTIKMAKAEGWLGKPGSKWQTMPELMMRYRSAAFFGRLYAPEIMMGMHTEEEIKDFTEPVKQPTQQEKETERVRVMINDAETVEDLNAVKDFVDPQQMDLFNEKLKEVSHD